MDKQKHVVSYLVRFACECGARLCLGSQHDGEWVQCHACDRVWRAEGTFKLSAKRETITDAREDGVQ